jgi:hypothetical protein
MKPRLAYIQGEIPVTVVTPRDIAARDRCKSDFVSECSPVWSGRSLTPDKTVNRVISGGRSFGLAVRKQAIESNPSPVGVTQFSFSENGKEKNVSQVVEPVPRKLWSALKITVLRSLRQETFPETASTASSTSLKPRFHPPITPVKPMSSSKLLVVRRFVG